MKASILVLSILSFNMSVTCLKKLLSTEDFELRDNICMEIFKRSVWIVETQDEELNRLVFKHLSLLYFGRLTKEIKKELNTKGEKGKDAYNILAKIQHYPIPYFRQGILLSKQKNLGYIDYYFRPITLPKYLKVILNEIKESIRLEAAEKFLFKLHKRCFGSTFDLYTAKSFIILFNSTPVINEIKFKLYHIIRTHLKNKYQLNDSDIRCLLDN